MPVACKAAPVEQPVWQEGRDGVVVAYAERVWPAWWSWVLAPALVSVLAIAYGSAYAAAAGWAMFLLGTGLVYVALIALSPVVRVDDRVLRAGRARLPLQYVGTVSVLDRASLRDLLRSGDARAYLVVRAWATPAAVLVEVTDAADPHPYWIVSSRHPAALAKALTEAPRTTLGGNPAE